RTPTPTIPPEPAITFFGVTTAADELVNPLLDVTPEGYAIYERPGRYNFSLVIEARPGGTRTSVGTSAFNWNPNDPTALPDLQIEVSRPLGDNPTTAVCDDTLGRFGGVPAIDPPDFSPTQPTADAINDF